MHKPVNPYDDISARIRDTRQSRGMTQSEAAVRAGLKHPTWSRFESGINRPNLESLSKIADALDVSVDWLMGRQTDAPTVSARLSELVAIADDLSDRQLKMLCRIARVLAEEG